MSRTARIPLLAVLALAISALAAPAGALAFGPLSSFGSEGAGAGRLGSPQGVAISPDGSTYVAERSNRRISVFGPGGEFRFAFGKDVNATTGTPNDDVCTAVSGCIAGRSVFDAGALREPEDVAIGPDGKVFAVSPLSSRVDVFSPEGAFLYAFGKNVNATAGAPNPNLCTAQSGCTFGSSVVDAGSASFPKGVAVAEGRVYVVSNAQRRVDVFSEAGQFLFGFGKDVNAAANPADPGVCTLATNCKEATADGPGALVAPRHIAVAEGRVYVASEGAKKINVFSTEGRFLFDFGRETLRSPLAVAVSQGGEVFVGDQSARVSVFSRDGAFLRALGLGVADGAPTFQECAAVSVCRNATDGALLAPGSLEEPNGLSFDRSGALVVSEEAFEKARVERLDVRPVLVPMPPRPPVAKPSNRFELGKLMLNRRKGTATLALTVPGAGALTLAGNGVRQVRLVAANAATVQLTIKLAGTAKRKLFVTGKAKVRASITFTPTGGDAATQARALVLKKALRRPSRR